MKPILSYLASSVLYLALTIAQNHAAEFTRLCNPAPTSDTEISLGVYAKYHCNRRPASGQNANLGKIPRANTPEECIEACVKMAECDQVAWISGRHAGCWAARASGIDKYPGGLIITYREDCQRQTQPTIDQLRIYEKAAETQRDQCLLDKQTVNSTLATCQNALKTCQDSAVADPDPDTDPDPDDSDGADGSDSTDNPAADDTPAVPKIPVRTTCAGLIDEQVVEILGVKFTVRLNARRARTKTHGFTNEKMSVVGNMNLERCVRHCATYGPCRFIAHNAESRSCDQRRLIGGLYHAGGWCMFEKV